MSWQFTYVSSSSLSAGDLTILDGLNQFSMHIWARLTYTSGDGHAIGKHDGTNGVRLYYDAVATNGKTEAPKLLVTIGGTSVRAEPDENGLFTANEWHSFGGQWKPNDGSGVKVWFDGVNKCTGSSTAHGSGVTFPNLAANLYLGRQASSPSVGWSGQLGECGIWDEWLDPDEWAALAAGLSPLLVRPWALLLWTQMRAPSGGTEWYYLPQAETSADFSHNSTTWSDNDDYWAADDTVQDEPVAGGTGPTWSAYALVKANQVGSFWRDTTVENGTTYKYKLKARDTSENVSDFGSESAQVTPQAGITGSPLVPRLLGGKQGARRVRSFRLKRYGVWRDS